MKIRKSVSGDLGRLSTHLNSIFLRTFSNNSSSNILYSMGPGTSPQSDSVLCLLRRPEFWATPRSSPYKTYGGPWRTVTEISVTADHFPLAPSSRAAGSPHLVLSTQIFLGDLSASVGILGRPNSRSPAAGASPGTALNRGSPRVSGTSTHPLCRLIY